MAEEKQRTAGPEEKNGASLLEYMLLGSLIAVVCVIVVQHLGTETSEMFSKVGSGFEQTQ